MITIIEGTGCDGVAWIQVARDRDQQLAVVKIIMYIQVSYISLNFMTS
jgi:hypothetical protein